MEFNRDNIRELLLNMMADIRIDKNLEKHLEFCNQLLNHYEIGVIEDKYESDNVFSKATEWAEIILKYRIIIKNKLDNFKY